MRKSNLKRKLGWLETGLYLGGVALIAVFVVVRADSERLRQDGLAAFEEATASQVSATESTTAERTAGEDPSGPKQTFAVGKPNQELWAEKRIHEYEQSLRTVGEPPLAVLTIDNLDITVPVYNGTDEYNLNRGVGRIKGTARVDTDGNLGIAGHRDGFFRPLKDIQVGDNMELQTAGGTVTYAVSSIEIVEPDDVSVLSPTDGRTITLVTCYPFYYVGHAPKRFIVKAKAEHSLAKT